MEETGRTPAPADRTVQNMVAAMDNAAAEIHSLIDATLERGVDATAAEALRVINTIRATYASLL